MTIVLIVRRVSRQGRTGPKVWSVLSNKDFRKYFQSVVCLELQYHILSSEEDNGTLLSDPVCLVSLDQPNADRGEVGREVYAVFIW